MPKHPLISIIIPVYNGEKYIEEAILSVRHQDYPSTEIIVVDDGSVDNSGQIVKQMDDVIYYYQENGGPSSARNRGIGEANGDFLAFIDADDLWTKDKLSIQYKYLLENADVEFVFSHKIFHIEENTEKPPWFKGELESKPSPLLGASGLLARKNVFNIIGNYDNNTRFGENAEWLMRAKNAEIKYEILPESLVTLRIHRDNQTNNLNEMRSSILEIIKKSIDDKRKRNRIKSLHD